MRSGWKTQAILTDAKRSGYGSILTVRRVRLYGGTFPSYISESRWGAAAPCASGAEAGQGFGGAQLAFKMALENLDGIAAQVLAAAAWPGIAGKRRGRRAQHAQGDLPRIGRERAGVGGTVRWAEEAVSVAVEEDFARLQGFAADGAVGDVGQQPHEAGHPERKVRE